jgi:hypothetical protein
MGIHKGYNEFAATPTNAGSCIEFNHHRKNNWRGFGFANVTFDCHADVECEDGL